MLAFIPSAAMVALVAVNTGQLYSDWHTATSLENSVVTNAGVVPSVSVLDDLQAERQLSAAALADPSAYGAKLAQTRKLTDESATTLESLSGTGSSSVADELEKLDSQLRQLASYRSAVDHGTATQQQVYDQYTNVISTDLALFTALSQTGVASLDIKALPAMAQSWGAEMISREDAIITAATASGVLTSAQRTELAQVVGSQQFIYQDEVIPFFPASVSDLYRNMMSSATWQQKSAVEQELLDGSAVPTSAGQQWQQVMAVLTPELQKVNQGETAYILASGNGVINSLRTRLSTDTTLGAAGVILVVALTWYLISVLRRRIFELRTAALELQTRLPDVVERLRRGEQVDTEAELPELHYGGDELGMLGRALNEARTTAVETAVSQVEQYRGFERLLQRIARRTQLLIGLQMKRLTEMERRHEDSEVLEGLFDLDHLAARLRRYEENLVILGGGAPQRRWRKPVALLDVLRSAQSEVQDYRRIRIETENGIWISERAVGALVHVLAELMENAVAFSKPPTPVEVTATRVVHGLAIEIEDRGVGMHEEQYDEANAMMARPPKMDALSRADDVRLGLYVVAQLAANLALKVELRASSFGGTRVVVLVPDELVLGADQLPPPPAGGEEAETVVRLPLTGTPAAETAPPERVLAGVGGGAPDPAPASDLDPLPRRVRLASLATELREPRPRAEPEADAANPAAAPESGRPDPDRSSAAVGAFQRQSRLARLADEDDEAPLPHPSPGRSRAPEEDGR